MCFEVKMLGSFLWICLVDMDFCYDIVFGKFSIDVYSCLLVDCMLGD